MSAIPWRLTKANSHDITRSCNERDSGISTSLRGKADAAHFCVSFGVSRSSTLLVARCERHAVTVNFVIGSPISTGAMFELLRGM